MYNMMTCEGDTWVMGALFGDCSMAWFSLAIIVFLCLIVRRQCDDGIMSGINFNVIGAFVISILAVFVIVAVSGSARWALLGGIAGIGIGGFVGGLVLGGSESG